MIRKCYEIQRKDHNQWYLVGWVQYSRSFSIKKMKEYKTLHPSIQFRLVLKTISFKTQVIKS